MRRNMTKSKSTFSSHPSSFWAQLHSDFSTSSPSDAGAWGMGVMVS